MAVAAVQGAAAVEQKRSYNLPSGDAATTLNQFAGASGQQIIFMMEKVKGERTNAVTGDYVAREALDRMLAGTGLSAARDPATGAFVVSPKRTAEVVPRTGEVGPVSDPQPNPPPKTMSAKPSTLFAFLASWLLASTAAEAQTSTPAAKDEAIMLSPFQVDATADKGYLATQTLNGTRLKTDLRDLGAAMTIFTEEMMNDLAANSISDIVAFAPNTDPFVNRLTDAVGNGNDFLNVPVQYVTRGGTTAVVGQNFFGNNIPPDRFNAEAFTFTRGPNAILFGLGNPAGAFTSSSKRAKFRQATEVEVRTDSDESLRLTVDHNQVVIPRVLALRYAGLWEKARSFRDPSENFQRRHYLTLTLTPTRLTTLRVNYERGQLNTMAIRPWPVYDGLSSWVAAGSPLKATLGASGLPAGTQNAYGTAQLVSTQYSPAGTSVPTMNWLNMARSAIPNYPTYPTVSGKRSLNDPSLFPVEANVIGFGSFRLTNFQVLSAFLEQQITRDLFLEVAVNRTRNNTLAANAFIGDFDRIFADVNQLLPNGQPNPNVGRYYAESYSTQITAPSESMSKRAMLSYELDLTRRAGWTRWLGRHRSAAFFESANSWGWSSNLPTINVTPTAGFPASIVSNTNRVNFRYYLDPAAGVVSAGRDNTVGLARIYAGDPLPPADPSGVTVAYVAQNGGTASDTYLNTRALALQSQFLKGRLVITNGWREDAQAVYRAAPADYTPWQDARGVFPDPTRFGTKRTFPASRRDRSGRTYTRGAVLHALPWLSLTFNQSNNFQANDSTRNVFGNLLPNPEGEGRDYGLKFAFFQQRLVAEVSYYENFGRNRIDSGIDTGVAGPFRGDINSVWTAIATAENKPEYNEFPYAAGFNTWSDSTTGRSTGYEFSVTANPTARWRLTFNGSRRAAGETVDRGGFIRQYLNQNLPIWRANPAWLALPIAGSPAETVGSRVTRLENSLRNLDAIQGLPDDVYAPRWSFNLLTNYSFSPESRLRGFAVGANTNLRGPTVIGYAENAANTLIPTQPYYAKDFQTVGGHLSYSRKLFRNRIDWRLQLNVRNVFDQNRVFPLRTVDARDGTNRGVVATWRLNEPRTYVLTSVFKF